MVLRDMLAFISIKKELIKWVKAKNLKNAILKGIEVLEKCQI